MTVPNALSQQNHCIISRSIDDECICVHCMTVAITDRSLFVLPFDSGVIHLSLLQPDSYLVFVCLFVAFIGVFADCMQRKIFCSRLGMHESQLFVIKQCSVPWLWLDLFVFPHSSRYYYYASDSSAYRDTAWSCECLTGCRIYNSLICDFFYFGLHDIRTNMCHLAVFGFKFCVGVWAIWSFVCYLPRRTMNTCKANLCLPKMPP